MRKTLSNSVLYFATNFLSKAVGFLLLPILTNPAYLSPAGYGQILLFSSLSLLLNPLIIFGGLDMIAIHYFDKNVDQMKVIRESNTIALIFFGLSTVVFLAFSPLLISSLGISFEIILILPFSAFLNYYSEQLLILLRFKGNARAYFIVFLIKIILDAGITLLCLTVFHWGWYSRIAGIFAGLIFSFLISMKLVSFRNLSMPFGKVPLKDILARCFPFVLIQFFIIGLNNLDKVIIPQIFRKDELAVYGIAFQLCYLLPTVAITVMTIIQPMLYRILSDTTLKEYNKLKKILGIAFLVIGGAAVAIYLVTPVFYYFIKDEHYHRGIYLVKYLLIAWTLWCFGAVLTDVVKKIGTKKQIVSSYFIPFILFVVTMYVFSHLFGLKGVAFSLIVSYGSLFLLITFFTRKQLRITLQRRNSLR